MSSKQTGSMKSTQNTVQQKNARTFKNQKINTLDRTQGNQLVVVSAASSQRGTFGLPFCAASFKRSLNPPLPAYVLYGVKYIDLVSPVKFFQDIAEHEEEDESMSKSVNRPVTIGKDGGAHLGSSVMKNPTTETGMTTLNSYTATCTLFVSK